MPNNTENLNDQTSIHFYGSNWADLDRMIALARFQFLQDEDYDDNAPRKCAYLAQRFLGPALDWVTTTHASNPAVFENFEGFILAVKQAFGVEANNITALRRKQLDQLRWSPDAPVFFAEFDRLTFQLGITDHATKIIMVMSKLPTETQAELARQALSFENYETMRERFNTMWALNPHKSLDAIPVRASRPRCGKCGKKGHTARDCRAGQHADSAKN